MKKEKKYKKYSDFKSKEECVKYLNKSRIICLVKYLVLTILGYIMFPCSMAGIVISSIVETNPSFLKWIFFIISILCMLMLTPILLVKGFNQIPTYKRICYECLTKHYASDVYEDFSFEYKHNLTNFNKQIKKYLRKLPQMDSSSYYKGKIDSVPFESFSYVSNMQRSKDNSLFALEEANNRLNQRKPTGNMEVSSRYVILYTNKKVNCSIYINSKSTISLFKNIKTTKKLETESFTFNCNYTVSYTGELEDVYMILTPVLINGINYLTKVYGSSVDIYIQDNIIQFFINKYNPGFIIGLSKKIKLESLEAFEREIKLPYTYVKELNLI